MGTAAPKRAAPRLNSNQFSEIFEKIFELVSKYTPTIKSTSPKSENVKQENEDYSDQSSKKTIVF